MTQKMCWLAQLAGMAAVGRAQLGAHTRTHILSTLNPWGWGFLKCNSISSERRVLSSCCQPGCCAGLLGAAAGWARAP